MGGVDGVHDFDDGGLGGIDVLGSYCLEGDMDILNFQLDLFGHIYGPCRPRQKS